MECKQSNQDFAARIGLIKGAVDCSPMQITARIVRPSSSSFENCRVEPQRFENHERCYLIVDKKTEQPLFDPTVYCLAQLRSRNLSANTIRNRCYSILALLLAADAAGIPLTNRVQEAKPLTLAECHLVSRYCRYSVGDLRHLTSTDYALLSAPSKTAYFRGLKVMAPATFRIRLDDAWDYVDWLYDMEMSLHEDSSPEYRRLFDGLKRLRRYRKIIKFGRRRTTIGQREGLSPDSRDLLLQAVCPTSSMNPFSGTFCRSRNLVIVLLGLKLGLRPGEILGLDASADLDLVERTLMVRRRADDPDDRRDEQPNAKTRDRILRFDEETARAIERYLRYRGQVPGARTHGFLIVAARTGVELSPSGYKKIFKTLREKVTGLPADLVSYLLRHTFNDLFSELADKKKLPEAKEVKARNYANGWSENSTTARTYTRRYTRRQATAFSLELQAQIVFPAGTPSERAL